MKFKKIKILGFKSFVDPTELDIDEGLTGIVGPNVVFCLIVSSKRITPPI